MSDLIRRKDMINKIISLNMQVYEGNTCVGTRTYLTKEEIIYAIDDIPSVELERKKGKWVIYDYPDGKKSHYIECNQCGKPAIWTNGISYKFPNYCPNCGADMRDDHE